MENIVYFALTDSADLSREAWRLMRLALQPESEASVSGDADTSYQFAYDENGKPYLPGTPKTHISLSHTKGAVVVAISANPVGIDLEHPRRINPKVAARVFTDSERAYAVDDERWLEVWTRKEALLKRSGRLAEPAGATETLDHAEITTRKVERFTLSFCGVPAEFTLREVRL